MIDRHDNAHHDQRRLRLHILASMVSIALIVLLIFGTVAYEISKATILQEQKALHRDHAEQLAASLADEGRVRPIPERLEIAGKVSFAQLAIVRDELGTTVAVHGGALISKSASQSLLARIATLDSGNSGSFAISDQDYLWASAAIPGEPFVLLLMRPVVGLPETGLHSLGGRMAVAGFIVIWISVLGALLIAGAITRRFNEQNEQLIHQALHDPLTGLPNRSLLRERLEHALRLASREKNPQALLIMDLDRFKEVNDTLGHHVGDELLRSVSERLVSALRESDTPARTGGDEFAVLLPNTGATGAMACARKILDSLAPYFAIDAMEFEVSTSIGIAIYPQHGLDVDTLIQHADVAMYQAKGSKSDVALYAADDDPHSIKRLTLSADLREAIERDQFTLCYQPKVCLHTWRVVGVEALLRWRHPRRGFVPPDEFIPIAEQTGLIQGLTDWVLRRSLEQCRAWLDRGIECSVAVNLSPLNVQDLGLPARIEGWLSSLDVPPRLLQLELTETAAMSDVQRAAAIFDQLSEMGASIAVDDFGTGMSSLSYLKRLPVSDIKIDRSFVIDLNEDENNAVIVRSIIDLSHNIGRKVVAEGVEDLETLRLLERLHCDFAQGYYLSKPKPAEEIEPLLSTTFEDYGVDQPERASVAP